MWRLSERLIRLFFLLVLDTLFAILQHEAQLTFLRARTALIVPGKLDLETAYFAKFIRRLAEHFPIGCVLVFTDFFLHFDYLHDIAAFAILKCIGALQHGVEVVLRRHVKGRSICDYVCVNVLFAHADLVLFFLFFVLSCLFHHLFLVLKLFPFLDKSLLFFTKQIIIDVLPLDLNRILVFYFFHHFSFLISLTFDFRQSIFFEL